MKLKRSRKPDVHAGQTGRTGPTFGVQNTRYERRGGCGADEIYAVIRAQEGRAGVFMCATEGLIRPADSNPGEGTGVFAAQRLFLSRADRPAPQPHPNA